MTLNKLMDLEISKEMSPEEAELLRITNICLFVQLYKTVTSTSYFLFVCVPALQL